MVRATDGSARLKSWGRPHRKSLEVVWFESWTVDVVVVGCGVIVSYIICYHLLLF